MKHTASLRIGLGIWLTVFSAHSGAQVLRVDSDLLIKPSAEWSEVVGRIDVAPTPSMSNMTFLAPPYGAKWSNVQAMSMDGLRITTNQEPGGIVSVSMTWEKPAILIYNMDMDFGRCYAVNWRLPDGQWQAEGHMTYDFAAKKLVWVDFSFLNNAGGGATVNLGDCSFGADHLETLTNHLIGQAANPDWMRALVQESILKWASVTFASAKVRLLDPITVQMGPYTTMTWQPAGVIELPNGMWRVPGQLLFDTSDALPKYDYGTTRRTEAEVVLNSIATSQFVLPVNAMENIAAALARNRGFFSRTISDKMPSFTQLFTVRKVQNMEWSDLKSFPLGSKFAFDVTVYGPVTLGDRRTVTGGLSYSAKTSLAIHSHADIWDQWFPYFDFRSVESGRLKVAVRDGDLNLQHAFDALHTRSYLRDEFMQVRNNADDFVNMDLINPRFIKFFQSRVFSVGLPRWRMGNDWELMGSGLVQQPRSLRVPLLAKPKN